MARGVSPGYMTEMLDLATLDEAACELIDGDESIKALVTDHETCIRSLRDVITKAEDKCNDVGTADFLAGLIQPDEQSAWMLRSSCPSDVCANANTDHHSASCSVSSGMCVATDGRADRRL